MDALPHQAQSLYHESTVESADSIESHPALAGVFALGTYQVDQQEQEGGEDVGSSSRAGVDDEEQGSSTSPEYSRRGTLRLKRVRRAGNKDGRGPLGSLSCDTLFEVKTAAVLDMKWVRHPSADEADPWLLSVAMADSTVAVYSCKPKGDDGALLEPLQRISVNSTNALCLSLDWSDRTGGLMGACAGVDRGGGEPPEAIVSQSDGTLARLSNTLSYTPAVETWKAHDYEAWTVAYDCWSNGRVAWSGGDDLCLKGWDVRTPCIDNARTPTFTQKRCFEGGVTSMQSHHLRQHLWAVGSYDGQLRLFDARQPMRPLSTTETGGGIWRIKWHPSKEDQLLVGCMHDGFKVLQLMEGDEPMKVHTRFDEHGSLAYGCDWDRGADADTNGDGIFSCSFYDATWHAWQCKTMDAID